MIAITILALTKIRDNAFMIIAYTLKSYFKMALVKIAYLATPTVMALHAYRIHAIIRNKYF